MPQDKKDKLNDYKQRHSEWQNISVTQLSNTNNILLTLSSGLLVYYFNKSTIIHIHVDIKNIDNIVTTYAISMVLLFLSMTYGIAVLISRLYDFRISRHIALTRQRMYEKNTKMLSDDDFEEFNFCDRIKALVKVIFCKLPFIKLDEIKKLEDEVNLKKNFKKLIRIYTILGSSSWILTKLQILLFLLSFFLFLIYSLLL